MKKLTSSILGLVLVVGLALTARATSYGDVKDDNNGTSGQILVNTGVNSGSADIGRWTNPSDIPALKGDTGATGAIGPKGDTGPSGVNGTNGVDGINSTNGLDGKDGINGVDGLPGPQGDKGDTGLNGTNGSDGLQGIKGEAGPNGSDGAKGDKGDLGATGVKGDQGFKGEVGIQGIQGTAGKDVDPATVNDMNKRIHEMNENKVVIEGAVRLYDSKLVQLQLFNSYDVRHGRNFMSGTRLIFKVGKSYEEKLIAKQNARMTCLSEQIKALREELRNNPPAAIWFVSTYNEVEKVLPKDPKYIKQLLKTKKR